MAMHKAPWQNISMRMRLPDGPQIFCSSICLNMQQVAEFVLKLSTPQYYNDPVVKHGYMRGHETVTYVARIHDRWRQYRGAVRGNGATKFLPGITPGGDIPHKAARKHRFKL